MYSFWGQMSKLKIQKLLPDKEFQKDEGKSRHQKGSQ